MERNVPQTWGTLYARRVMVISRRWQNPNGAHGDRPLSSARIPTEGEAEEEKKKRKKGLQVSPSDSGESATVQPGTMCWIGSLYISLPFGHSNATLPYEGTSTRSTCSKQNAIGDQLQRPPSCSDCFSDRHSHLQDRGGVVVAVYKLFCQSPNN